jgi:RimJ/RimL family protein N-acetyltransferase
VLRLQTSVGDVELREVASTDAHAYYALLQANRDHLGSDYAFEFAEPVEAFPARFGDPENKSVLFGIWRDEVLIGHIALVYGEPPRWGLGYWLDSAATGRRIATAAVAALLTYARDKLGATEVLARVSHGNEASVSAAPQRLLAGGALRYLHPFPSGAGLSRGG